MDKLAGLPPRMGHTPWRPGLCHPVDAARACRGARGITGCAARGEFRPVGSHRVVGALADDVLDYPAMQGMSPATAAISIGDKDLLHALSTTRVQPLSAETLQKLPTLLATLGALYWDVREPGLIYVVTAPDVLGKWSYSLTTERSSTRKNHYQYRKDGSEAH